VVTINPQRLEPFLFENFYNYEDALLLWGAIVSKLDVIPPNPNQIGEIFGFENHHVTDSDPLPPNSNILPPPQLHPGSFITEGMIPKLAQLLQDISEIKPYSAENSSKNEKPFSLFPEFDQKQLIFNLLQTGIFTFHGSSFSSLLKNEHQFNNFAFHSQSHLLSLRKINKKAIITKFMADHNVNDLLLTDFSPKEFDYLLRISVTIDEENFQFGQIVAEYSTFSDLLKILHFSTCQRFTLRLSILLLYFFTLPKKANQLFQLDFHRFDLLVEVTAFAFPYSSPYPESLDLEYDSVVQHVSNLDKFNEIANTFHRASILNCLRQINYSNPTVFYSFSNSLRSILHKIFSGVSSMISTDVDFEILTSFFMSEDENIHLFGFRLLRTVISLQYSRVIYAFSRHNLFKFFLRLFIRKFHSFLFMHIHSGHFSDTQTHQLYFVFRF
jgi:hypothetical protein